MQKLKNYTVATLTDVICEFCDARGWKNENPPELITALVAEIGELSDYYLWQKDFTHIQKLSPVEKEALGYEFVDILVYLLRLAQRSGINIEESFQKKLPKLARKFPIHATQDQHRLAHKLYRAKGMNKNYHV